MSVLAFERFWDRTKDMGPIGESQLVLTPTDDRTIDSIIKGGMFGSALGVSESDILSETLVPEIKYPMRNPGTENIFENDEIMTSFS